MKGVMFWPVAAVLTVLAFLSFIIGGSGEFIEEPISTEVSVNKPAVFRCQHPSADIIRWRVNGSLISTRNADPDMHVDRDSSGREILRIIPRTVDVYVVVCVAQFDSGSPDVPSAIAYLTVSTNTTGDEVTMTTYTSTPFNENSGFLVSPTSLNVTVGQRAVFQCRHSTADTIVWKINGRALNALNTTRISVSGTSILPDRGIQENLTVDALLEYNNTSITCVGLFLMASSQISSQALLLIQGPLDAPTNLSFNQTTITWNPPASGSLDLTGVDPDVVYCVEVYKIICGGRENIINNCNVVEPIYLINNTLISPDYIHKVVITPRSNALQSMNGSKLIVKEHYVFLRDILFSSRRKLISPSTVKVDVEIRLNIVASPATGNVWPSMYSVLFTSSDEVGESEILVITNVTDERDDSISLTASKHLESRRLWDVVLLAYNCSDNVVTDVIQLSTHEIQASVTTDHLGHVIISGTCIEGSTTIGMLVIVYSLISDSDIAYLQLNNCLSDMQNTTIKFRPSSRNLYTVSVFAIDQDGLPFNRSAIKPQVLSIDANTVMHMITNPSVSYDVIFKPDGVCVNCKFLDNIVSYCVVVVHKRISQLNSSGLMNIESSHKLTRSGDTASGCIEGVNMEDYQVGVVGGRQAIGDSTSIRCGKICIIGSVVVGAILTATVIITILTVIVCAVKRKIKNKGPTNDDTNVDIETSKCEAYEMVSLAKKKVVMEENPAYEDINAVHVHYATIQ